MMAHRRILFVWVILLLTIPVTTALADANRLFQELSLAGTTTERKQICEDLDSKEVPEYAALFCDGFELLAAGEDSLAVRYLREALRLQSDFALGCVLYADYYMESTKLDPAARWYRQAAAIDPNRLDPYYGLGQIWMIRAETQGEAAYEKALDAFREMSRIEPDSPDGWANVGMVEAMLGRFDEAQKALEKARRIAPGDASVHSSLGSLASLRGDDAMAERWWKRALELDPTHVESARELAALYGRQGKIVAAIELLQTSAERVQVGREAGRLRRDLGTLYVIGGRLDEAGDLLERARVLSPDARTLCALAHLRFLQGSEEIAREHLAEAAAIDPETAAPFTEAWSETPVTDETTRRLFSTFLPDWKLPQGTLPMPDAPPTAPYDTAPVPVYRAPASYPDAAGGIDGTVTVLVKIDEHGIVRDAEVVTKGGNPALEWAALDAAKKWRFEPAMLAGNPVPAEVTIPFQFTGSR